MTPQQIEYFRKVGKYKGIIEMSAKVILLSTLIQYSLMDLISILSKFNLFRHSNKYIINKDINILDKIIKSNFDIFSNKGVSMSNMILSINDEIDNNIYESYKCIFLLDILSNILYKEITKYEPFVVHVNSNEIKYVTNNIINDLKKVFLTIIPQEDYDLRLNAIKIIFDSIYSRFKVNENEDKQILITYDKKK